MGRRNFLAAWLLSLFISAPLYAALPAGLSQLAQPLSASETLSLGTFAELQTLIAEAESNPRAPMVIGANRDLDLDLSAGSWQPLNNGNTLWRVAIQSNNAAAISLKFSNLALADDAELWLYAPNAEQAHGPYKQSDVSDSGEFWSPQVAGDTIVVELEQASHSHSKLNISQLGHGNTAWWREGDTIQQKAAGSCHINVSCSTANGHSSKVRATARLIYTSALIQYACSGTLMNNSSQDGTPYFLTANHCISDNLSALTATTYWQYESDRCGSNTPPSNNKTVSGATLVATWSTSDFSLLRLNSQPGASFNPYWSGWDRSGQALGSGVGIHHPDGDVKKISIENDPMVVVNGSANPLDATNADGLYVRVGGWDSGTTEPGSSGSGIWNPANRVVGQLSAGNADCSNPNGQDYYGWLGQSWDGGGTPASRLKDWLAPSDNSIQTLDGCDHHNQDCNSTGSANPPKGSTASAESSGGGGAGTYLGLLAFSLFALRRRKAY